MFRSFVIVHMASFHPWPLHLTQLCLLQGCRMLYIACPLPLTLLARMMMKISRLVKNVGDVTYWGDTFVKKDKFQA